ncbi:MAG TPA: fasciclin domain-containing protein [Bacteroidales bacterium]
MKKLTLIMLAIVSTLTAFSQDKNIVDVASSSKDFTTLVAALEAADLVTTLQGEGPFTVFAPTNDAFNKLPEGTVASLLLPENKQQLAKILTYHVVSGNLDASAVVAAIKKGKGKAVLTTVSGGTLTATLEKDKVKLTSDSGNYAYVIQTDLKASNGVIHVIDSVLLPK